MSAAIVDLRQTKTSQPNHCPSTHCCLLFKSCVFKIIRNLTSISLLSTIMANPPDLSGVYVSMITMFKDTQKQEIDIGANQEHILYLRSTSLKGALILGSTGEQTALTRDERKTLIKSVCDILIQTPVAPSPHKGPVPTNSHNFHNFIMAGVGGQSVQECITFAQDAAEAGAKYALAHPPSFYTTNMTADALESYYNELADQSPIPVLIYSSAVPDINIRPDSIERLASHENIVGIIQLQPDDNVDGMAVCIQTTSSQNFYVLGGASDNLLDALQDQLHGAVTSMGNFFPRTIQRIYDLYQTDQLDEAESLQRRLCVAEWCIQKHDMPAVKHATTYLRNYPAIYANPRRPIPLPSTKVKAAIETALSDLAFYEKHLEEDHNRPKPRRV